MDKNIWTLLVNIVKFVKFKLFKYIFNINHTNMTEENQIPEAPQEEQTQPSKEEMLSWMNEQIEFKTVQVQLAELNTTLAELKAREMQAIYRMSQLSTPPEEEGQEMVPYTITEKDIEENPAIKEQGYKAGDTVSVPSPKRKLKK